MQKLYRSIIIEKIICRENFNTRIAHVAQHYAYALKFSLYKVAS